MPWITLLKIFGPILLITVAVGGGIYWYQHQITAAYNSGVKDGKTAEDNYWKKVVQKNTEEHKKETDALQTQLDQYIGASDARNAEQRKHESDLLKTLDLAISKDSKYQQCRVDQGILDTINNVRTGK